MQADRLRKLARHLDALAARDTERIRQEQEIETLRRRAAVELHGVCAAFVREVNTAVSTVTLDLAPLEYAMETFQDSSANVIQINISGRVIQLVFEATEPLLATEDLRTPYTLEGSVRWYNQQMIERDEISDHNIYYCVDKRGNEWRYYDPRTHRGGTIDEEYLASLLEQLV